MLKLPRRIKYLTQIEIDKLLGVIKEKGDVRDHAIFTVAYGRGLRASEVALISVSDYNPVSRRLFVTRLKDSNSAQYMISPEEVKALNKWIKIRGIREGPLFWSYRNYRVGVGRKRLDQLMKKYCSMTNLPLDKSHFHVLKHSIATHLLEKGVGIADVQDWLGHKSIMSTMVYAQVTSQRRDEVAKEVYSAKH